MNSYNKMKKEIKSRLERGINNGDLFPIPEIGITLDMTTAVKYDTNSIVMEFVYMDANGKFGSQYRNLNKYEVGLQKILDAIQKAENTFIVGHNELIAEFMGAKGTVDYHNNSGLSSCYWTGGNRINGYALSPCSAEELKYHLSWDWLMPVIKKCRETIEPIDRFGACSKWIKELFNNEDIFSDNISNTHDDAVKFIKCYNRLINLNK